MPDAFVANKLERRAKALAGAITRRKQLLAAALGPVGSRQPFTKQLTNAEALSWWQQHYDDALGRQWRGQMDLESRLELDKALAVKSQQGMLIGQEPSQE